MLPFSAGHAVQALEGPSFTDLRLRHLTGILKPPRQGNMGQGEILIVCDRGVQVLLCPSVEGQHDVNAGTIQLGRLCR